MVHTGNDLDEHHFSDECRKYAPVSDAQIRRAEQKEKAKDALAAGGRVLASGAQMAASGYKRYQQWVDRVNREALERGERDRQEHLERKQREVERRKHAMELQREQRQLDLEERRLQMEMQREEMEFRREFGRQPPRQQQGFTPSFGFAPQPQRGSYLDFGRPIYDYEPSPQHPPAPKKSSPKKPRR